MNAFALSSLSASLASIFLGAFVFNREPRNPLHRVFFLFCLVVAYAGFAEYELRTAETAAEAVRWVKVSCAWPLAPAAFFHFAVLYTRGERRRRNGWAVPLVYAVALAASVLFGATDVVASGTHREYWGWTATLVRGGLSTAVMASITLIGLAPVYLCIRHVRRLHTPGERKQAGAVALGYLVPVLIFVLTEIVSPLFTLRLPEVTTLGSLLGALIIWFGIRRFKLFVLSPQTVDELDRMNQRLQREIAEHVRAAAALAASEERFRSLFENSTMGLYRTTPDGQILLANPALVRMLGYESFEELGRQSLEADGFDAPYPRSDFKKRIEKDGEIHGLEAAWKRKDGTTVFVRESAKAIRDAAGKLLCYEGTVEDVTDRRKAQEALQAGERRYRELADLLPQALFETDIRGILTYTNRSALRIFGYDKEDFARGLNVLDLVVPEQRTAALDLFRVAMAGEDLDNAELSLLRKDGNPLPIIIYVRTIIKDGRPAGLSGIAADVTLVKKTEEALKASLREKEVLLREIHHRVKNNMQIISSLLSLQAREIADPAVVAKFRESRNRIRSMAFVHEMLYRSSDLSRVTFSDYIRSLANHLTKTYLLDAERIRIEAEIEDIALEIETAIPCGLIINELVTNAIKHAFPDGRAGTIRIELRRAPGEQLLLRVADDGVGFPAGLDFQLTESLGMQIVLMLVDQLEGAIEREPGPGTSFRIDFGEVKYKTKY